MSASSASNLNLWKKRLGQVPDSVWQQTEIETLILADNNLSELSGWIGHLKKLRMLDLGHNQLTQLPDEIGGLPHLTDFLYLHDNRLTSLPSSFAILTRLRYLNISKNAFEVFPECISSCERPTTPFYRCRCQSGSFHTCENSTSGTTG